MSLPVCHGWMPHTLESRTMSIPGPGQDPNPSVASPAAAEPPTIMAELWVLPLKLKHKQRG